MASGQVTVQKPLGVLDMHEGRRRFATSINPPAPRLAGLVEHYWAVRWDLCGRDPYLQHTLSNASVHLVVERDRSTIQGVVTGRFTRLLEGSGRVFGVKFRPAGFRPFLGGPVSALSDRSIPVSRVFGPDGDAFVEQVRAQEDEARRVKAADAFLLERLPAADPNVLAVSRLVVLVVEDRTITRVDQMVERTGVGKRTLQRLFREYVGVSPKWVIQRYRLHEAVERLAGGQDVDLAALALELGYYDQAHFVREFKALVGRPPATYARAGV